jgi:arsenate reductase (thioredoxin)
MRTAAMTALLLLASSATGQSVAADSSSTDVVFICEHGAAKSVLAAALFNRTAQKQELPFRSVARGLHPESHVPPKIAAALRVDGFNLADYRPLPVSDAEIASASRVVTIGVESAIASRRAAIETWNDVPSPSDYPATRAALQRHIDALVASLQSQSVKKTTPQTRSERNDPRL